jgi:hypothetical protein
MGSRAMTSTAPALPPGFELEEPKALPALPPGFVPEVAQQAAASGSTEALLRYDGTDERTGYAALDLPDSTPTAPAAPAIPAPLAPRDPNAGSPGALTGQTATGLVEGGLSIFDLPATVETALRSIGPGVSNALFNTKFAKPEPLIPRLGSNAVGAMDRAGMLAGDPDGLLETIFRRTGQELGASAVPVVGNAMQATRPVVALAKDLGVALGSGVGAGTADYVVGDDDPNHRMVGDLVGQIMGGVTAAGAMRAGRIAVTPFPNQPVREQMAQTMADEGVHLTAGQRTGNKGLQYAESELGGSGAANRMDQQGEQFTRAALSRAGVNADRATPEVIDQAFTRIGRDFDEVAAHSTARPDQQLSDDLTQTVDAYENNAPTGMQAPIIRNVVNGLSHRLSTTGALDGPTYQAYRTQLDEAARGAAGTPYLQEALYGIRNALDDAVERGLAQSNPDLVPVWQDARRQYRSMIVLQDAASRAGENAALGLISPANLRSAVVQHGRRAYMRGDGDFADLARGGVATMTPLPNSGTAPRQAVRGVTASIPGAVGAIAGNNLAGAPGALAGLLAGALVPRAAGAAVMSRPAQAYLGNQFMRPSGQGASWLSLPAGALAQMTMDDQLRHAVMR